MSYSQEVLEFVDLIGLATERQVLKKVVFSKCDDKDVTRATLTLRKVGGRVCWQLERLQKAPMAETAEAGRPRPIQAYHENLSSEDAEALRRWVACCGQVNLLTTVGDAELKRAKSGKVTLLGVKPLSRALAGTSDDTPKRLPISEHNKEKQHILHGDEPFLVRLGISDERGRVHDKKQSKFRQINRFLEMVRDVESALPADGELHICDLCCGKSYLSFAIYHYFSEIRHRAVRMVGVDMKADAMDTCNRIAADVGFAGLSFVCADVSQYAFDGEDVHMVVALHACDTATDLVLDKALEWQSKVILATPCCHHDLARHLDCPALSFVSEHSMLRQKFCDAATDALRLKRLEACGYDVAALELIDPEETPKNVLLRGIRRYDPSSARCRKADEAYKAAYRFLRGEEVCP